MSDSSGAKWLWEAVGPFIPPALGAFIGLRYAAEASKRDQVIAWACSAAGAIILAPMAAEIWQFGPRTTVGAGFLIAMFGSQLFAVVIAALKQWATDPVTAFRRWRSAWLGSGDDK